MALTTWNPSLRSSKREVEPRYQGPTHAPAELNRNHHRYTPDDLKLHIYTERFLTVRLGSTLNHPSGRPAL
ncbi:hypothetical protein DPX16_7197 [Anabarilius grahami]|uniref:Uncharacterized protein n=1 Tax=Anabarilius grahami TaxID=495550 RepID=A0A3N0XNM6_ANAGA|nr:hypothetical protein DPX16_7197 [Anabarilius grahami]